MTTNTTNKPDVAREELGLSYGYTWDLIHCPVCKSSPGFDRNGEMIGEDMRKFALVKLDGIGRSEGRLCEPCAEAIVGKDVLDLIDKMQLVSVDLHALEDAGDLPYGKALVRLGASMILTAEAGTVQAHARIAADNR